MADLVRNTLPAMTHIPRFVSVVHAKLWIFASLYISHLEQTCKWGIKYGHSVTTDHVGKKTTQRKFPNIRFRDMNLQILILCGKMKVVKRCTIKLFTFGYLVLSKRSTNGTDMVISLLVTRFKNDTTPID